ncbi:MAG TPA: DUF1194 domain-containing protein [Paracoccaceae bacterium]
MAGAAPALAGCRLALALAIDVSRSVDARDYIIQRDGLVAALTDPAVRDAFLRPADHVALAVYEWSGRGYQAVVADWTGIHATADLDGVAALIAGHERSPRSLPTALGWALEFGRQLMAEAPDCEAQVLDVSGDGRNNDGMGPQAAYARRDFGGLTVNALAIGEHEADVVHYYRTEVIRGPGAFVEVAPTQADFPPAIRRKLLRELAERVFGMEAAGPEGRG